MIKAIKLIGVILDKTTILGAILIFLVFFIIFLGLMKLSQLSIYLFRIIVCFLFLGCIYLLIGFSKYFNLANVYLIIPCIITSIFKILAYLPFIPQKR